MEGPRRRILESHLRMLEQLSEHDDGDPGIGFLAAEVRAELATDHVSMAALRIAIRRFPADRRLPARFRWKVADWIAEEVDAYRLGPEPTGRSMDCLEPNAHAQAVIRGLESRCEALGVGPGFLPTVALKVAVMAACRGEEERKARRLHDARRTAACLSAFAEALARRDPDEAAFHLLLCEAFEQESKNAWKIEDYEVIEETLRKALGAARTAIRLAPQDTTARMKIAGLQEKLADLDAALRLSRRARNSDKLPARTQTDQKTARGSSGS